MTCKERILSNQYADIITEYLFLPGDINLQGLDYCFERVNDELNILYIDRKEIQTLSIAQSGYGSIPKCYGLMENQHMENQHMVNQHMVNTQSLAESGILELQDGPLYLTGKGVTICFIDTGISYENPVFCYPDGSTRIKAIWDQTIQTGIPPKTFEYGTEYRQEEINKALASNNPKSIVPSIDINGHGTAMASIATGSKIEKGRGYTGAAPDANIVVVKLKEMKPYLKEYYFIPEGVPSYSENDIINAIKYCDTFATSFSKPIVICIGIGSNLGDHAGSSTLSKYIDLIGQRKSRAVVVAGGNEGNAAHHFYSEFTKTDTVQDVEIKVGLGEKGFVTELWGEIPYLFTIGITSPGGEEIPKIFPRTGLSQRYSFIFETTKITVDYQLVEPNDGGQLIYIRVANPTEGIWKIKVYREGDMTGGSYHMWLPITQHLHGETYFLQPDPNVTLTEPAYTDIAITTSTYNDSNNSFYINSGRGYSKNNRIKPDIAAPGVMIPTIKGSVTGSSMASAITGGGVAQLLEWAVIRQKDVFVNSSDIKNYLIRGATREQNRVYPNKQWGYGRLNMVGIFDWIAGR